MREEQAHVTEDNEPMLMLAHTEISSLNLIPLTAQAVATTWPLTVAPLPWKEVELVVEEMFLVLGEVREGDLERWIFDTGASNHMTDFREAYADLDTSVVAMVHFGNGSVVWIEGCGTILFMCNSGEHQTLAITYYIPWLTANIMSYDLFGEDGF
jgi:hypothetical protein